MNAQPLTDIELDKLTDVLKRFGDKRAMNLEMMDGFFAALICGPETVLPSEYLPEIWGGDVVNEPIFQTKPILEEFISLVTQHWNAICRTLQSGEVFLPLLLDDENGVARAGKSSDGLLLERRRFPDAHIRRCASVNHRRFPPRRLSSRAVPCCRDHRTTAA